MALVGRKRAWIILEEHVMPMPVVSTLFVLAERTFRICCGVRLTQYGETCYLHGTMPPIPMAPIQQCNALGSR